MRVAAAVAEAVAEGRPVVALESTLIAHGLPRPRNLEVAHELEEIVAEEGATPATVAVLAGEAHVGLDVDQLAHVATTQGIAKLAVRDLPVAAALELDGATTVASTAHLAATAGVLFFATGGLGGVHRGARDSWDESADLHAVAGTAVVVVCAGVKSILDVPATLERLETLGVPVVGWRTNDFPGFYRTSSGCPLDWRVDDSSQVTRLLAARTALGLEGRGVIVANPLPAGEQLDGELHDRVLAGGLERLSQEGITGKNATPFLLEHFHRETRGASLEVNTRIVRRNARLAARLAVAWARR